VCGADAWVFVVVGLSLMVGSPPLATVNVAGPMRCQPNSGFFCLASYLQPKVWAQLDPGGISSRSGQWVFCLSGGSLPGNYGCRRRACLDVSILGLLPTAA